MSDSRNEKLQAAMQDKKFVEELMALENVDDIQAKFASVGIEFTTEEVEDLVEQVVAGAGNENGELNEDALEGVSGGNPIVGMAIFIGLTAAGVYIGWKAGGCGKKKRR